MSFYFVCLWQNNLSLQGQRWYTDLSNINWLHDIIHILRVLRYKVTSGSKSVFNTFGSLIQGYLYVEVLSNLIFDFSGCYLLR